MKTIIRLHIHSRTVIDAWKDRRDESGGALDETAMIAVGFAIAVAIAGVIWAVVPDLETKIGEAIDLGG